MSPEQKVEGSQGGGPVVITGPVSADDMTLADYAAILWRRKWHLVVGLVFGAAIGLAIFCIRDKKYDANVLIQPPQNNDSSGAAAQLAGLSSSPVPLGLLGMKSPADSYVDILGSERVADAIIDRFDLMQKYGAKSRVGLRKKLGSNTVFDATKGSLITITFTDTSPESAAAIANAYAEILADIDSKMNVSSAGRERSFLDVRLKEVEKDMRAAEEAWKTFQEKHRIVAVDQGLQATATVIAELEARRMAKEIEVQVMETAYSKTNPQVAMARAELKKLEEKLKEVSRQGVRIGGEDGSQWLFPPVEQVPALALEQVDLQRGLKLYGDLYRLLVTQREVARVSEAKEKSSLQVISRASVPDVTSSPGLIKCMAAGAFLGCALTAVGLFLIFGVVRRPGA